MANKQEVKFLRFISLMTLAFVAFVCLISSACMTPVSTLAPVSVNKEVHIIAPSLEPAPTPIVPKSDKVCGFWNIRQTADSDSKYLGTAFNGSSVTLTGAEADALDGGKWVQVRGRDVSGWMNAKGLCGGEE